MSHYTSPLRSLLVGLSLLGSILLADTRADAATISLILDKESYAPGETVTLRLVGDSQGARDYTLWAAIDINRVGVLDPQVQTFVPPTGTSIAWLQGAIRGCNSATYPNRCALMNMIYPDLQVTGVGVDPALEPFTYAVLTATAGAPGVYPLLFTTTPLGQRLDFFGLTSAPGTTLLIHNPEPGTSALLALGLGGMALARRRRVRHKAP